jgi:AraC-like DNA-binding protein
VSTGREIDITFLAWSQVPQCLQLIDKHLIGYSTIQYMERGAVELSYDRREYRMEGSWFWTAYPGPRIRFTSADGQRWHHRHVGFKGPLVSRWVADGLWPTEPQPVPWEDFAPRFDALIELVRQGNPWSARRAANLLEGLLLQLAEARAGQHRTEAWLGEVLQALEASEHFVPDLDALARSTGMSASTLRRRFRAATGTSMHEHVIATRIVRAKGLLAETDLPLETIADRLGYTTAGFFSRQFKQIVGVSPSAFRRSRS